MSSNGVENNRTQKQAYADYVRQFSKINESNDITGGCIYLYGNPNIDNAKTCSTDFILAPVVQLYGEQNVILEIGEEYVDPGAFTNSKNLAEDIKTFTNFDASNNGNYYSNDIGNYFITYSVKNNNGYVGYITRFFSIITLEPASILLNGPSEVGIERYTIYNDLGVTISHIYDIETTLSITGSVDISNVGTYNLIYTATTVYNVSTSVSRSVIVTDTIPPSIELNGVSPMYVLQNSQFQDPGVNITRGILDRIDSNLDMTTLGTYTLTYNAIDDVGNTSFIQRTVTVDANIFPIILVNAPDYEQIYYNDPYSIPIASVLYGNLINTVDNLDLTKVGTYSITYYAESRAGLASNKTITVEIIDPTTVTLVGDAHVILERYDSYDDPGATANNRGSVSINTILPTGNLDIYKEGSYYRNYIAYDFQFNPLGSVTRTFIVEDTIAPVITIIGNNPLTHERGNVYIDPGATALDYGNIDYTNQIVITSDVCFNEVGTYSVNYNVTDDAGNQAIQVTRIVNIIDTTIPVITLSGPNPYPHEKNTDFQDPGYVAIDLSNIILTEDVVTVTTIDTTIPKKTFTFRA